MCVDAMGDMSSLWCILLPSKKWADLQDTQKNWVSFNLGMDALRIFEFFYSRSSGALDRPFHTVSVMDEGRCMGITQMRPLSRSWLTCE